ncbi:MAG: hypothetical protein AAFX93_17025 [Verrucomicrobiota bacterium]
MNHSNNPEDRSERVVPFDRRQQLDQEIKDSLSDLPPPGGLRESILLGCQEVKPKPRHNPALMSLAAAATLILTLTVLSIGYMSYYNSKISKLTSFRDAMAYYAAGAYFSLDHLSTELSTISNWLDENNSPNFQDIPEGLLAMEPIGCKQIDWRGESVSLVCFHRDDGKIVHLFIIEKRNGGSNSFVEIERIAESHGLQTGGWSNEDSVFLLSGSEPGVRIDSFLPFPAS